MGLGLAIVLIVFFGLVLGFMVVQAMFAARKWRQVIAEGDQDALEEMLDQTFEGWRGSRPPKGTPPADWRALHTAALIAADRDRARVSLLVDPDVRVVDGRRTQVGSDRDVARRAAVRMVERLFYEVPHIHFDEVQVDVQTDYRDPEGGSRLVTLLTTRVTRERASFADWEHIDAPATLAEWRTREAADAAGLDPDLHALIHPDDVARLRAEREAGQQDARQQNGSRS
ncbi:MAG: hypothetical protein GEU80_14455 [Dehalococcoidia bacterium]|nr:hypothetical protein [Dehalococcoidia bacterium]